MKNTILIMTLILLVPGCKQADQKSNIVQEVTEAELVEIDSYSCSYKEVPAEYIKTTPFGKADKIEIVSYTNTRRSQGYEEELINDGEFIVTALKQRATLTPAGKDSLFYILYNLKSRNEDSTTADCYSPNHSIIFYKDTKAIAFLELCFMCSGSRQSKNIDFGEMCDEKWCILQHFFKSNKVDYALIDEMCE